MLGGLLSAPALGFMVIPPFLKQGVKDHDLGPITDYPEGKYIVATFMADPKAGVVSRRSAYIRNNGQLNGQPSFTIISNHCAHLGCPVQPNGPLDPKGTKKFADVTLIPTISIAGFGCPCHGGQYDTEGNRIAGPPVRALDRYSFSIRKDGLPTKSRPFDRERVAVERADRRAGDPVALGVVLAAVARAAEAGDRDRRDQRHVWELLRVASGRAGRSAAPGSRDARSGSR